MATILNDDSIRKILGSIIIDGDDSSVRSNSYILRLGNIGEFLNSGKEFGDDPKKKGIKVQPGHAVAVTSKEEIDFRRETVHKIFPGNDLHGLLSPTTDLSREGLIAQTTQIDAGFHGTINWTISNTSNEERKFVFGERLFRLTLFLLAEGETPTEVYQGDYQDQIGYVRSKRAGAPVGMKDNEWIDSIVDGGPEILLDNLVKSGYPWNILGGKLKEIDQQFQIVTSEYSEIHSSMQKLSNDISSLRSENSKQSDVVRSIFRDESVSMQNRWLLVSGTGIITMIGAFLAAFTSEAIKPLMATYGPLVGMMIFISFGFLFFHFIRKN